MTTRVSLNFSSVEREPELTSRVVAELIEFKFFTYFPGRYFSVVRRRSDERDRGNAFVRFQLTTVHGELICTVEKVVEQQDDCVLIRHNNSHPSRGGKMQETHITKHTGSMTDVVRALSESVITTMSSLCRLADSY